MAQIPFLVSARAARLIGRENVANAEGAIIELVKNGYDADASMSMVVFDNKYYLPPTMLLSEEFKKLRLEAQYDEEIFILLANSYTPNGSGKYILNEEIVEHKWEALVRFFRVRCAIYIIDSGWGMSEDTIKEYWMTIGTDNKETNSKSELNRIKTGAKGIGRFALDRLGDKCEMITKTIFGDYCDVNTKETHEVESYKWEVDWSEFEGNKKSINDVKAELTTTGNTNIIECVHGIIKDLPNSEEVLSAFIYNSGTILKITNLRDDWSDIAVEKIFEALETLARPQEDNFYKIYLLSTLFFNKYGEVRPPIVDSYDYKIVAKHNKNHSIDITIYRNELLYNKIDKDIFSLNRMKDKQFLPNTFVEGKYSYTKQVTELAPSMSESFKKYKLDSIGEFDFTFYFGKLGEGPEERGTSKFPYRGVDLGARKEWLKKFGGIKIFRDGFKVRPYGEITGNSFDWLGLGQRSSQSPTVTKTGYHVRPNQVYGVINISRLENLDFNDKSSREGIQENPVFLVFKEIITNIIGEFERDRNTVMMSIKEIFDKKDEEEITNNKADIIAEKAINSSSANECEKEKKILAQALEYYKDRIFSMEEEQMLLRVLASSGLIITSFAHELNNLTERIVPRSDKLKEILLKVIDEKKLEEIPNHDNPYQMINDFRTQDMRLSGWLGFSLASVRKNRRQLKTVEMISYFNELERLWQTTMETRGIQFIINNQIFTAVYIDANPIDLDAIFNNLITNSIDAIVKKKRYGSSLERKIIITFAIEDKINITYEDTGPGLEEEIIDPYWVLRPFNTTKRNDENEIIGTGLGMYIVKTVIDQYDGEIEISNKRPGFNAIIKIPSKKN